MMKLLDSLLIVAAADATGFRMAQSIRYEERCLLQLQRALERMLCEIPGQLTPANELFLRISDHAAGAIKSVVFAMAQHLSAQTEPDISRIMDIVLEQYVQCIPLSCAALLRELGTVFGTYDLDRQVEALEGVSGRVGDALRELRQGKADRCRSYEVLGVCAGCALAIILL